MKAIKFFESVDERISFQISVPTIDDLEQEKEFLILIESPYTKKKDIVMTFDQNEALEILNEMLSVVHLMRSIKIPN